MGTMSNNNEGIKRLIQKCRDEFQLSENTDFYKDEDYKAAKRKYVKFCLMNQTRT